MQRITCFISKNKKPILKCHSKIQTALQLHGMMKVTNILKSIHYGPVKSIFTLIKGGLCHIVMMIVNCHFRMFLIEKVKPCSKRPSDLWVTLSTSFWDNMLQNVFHFYYQWDHPVTFLSIHALSRCWFYILDLVSMNL